MALRQKKCYHILEISNVKHPDKLVCESCVQTGDRWVHLRTCQTCGTTLCCDSSPNKHASKHAHEMQHAVVISAEPNERWMWCYEHKLFINY